MQKITLFFLAVMTAFTISSCKKTEEVAPATVVGIWKGVEIGAISNTKTYKVAPGIVVKSGTSTTVTVKPFTYEFKEDGMAILGTVTGTYKLSTDKKKVVLTSKDGDFNYEILSLTSTDLQLACVKLTKKATDSYDPTTYESFLSYLYAAYALVGGGGTEADIDKSTSLQATISFKK